MKPWYENINKPVLCWVWDIDIEYKRLAFVQHYKHGSIVPFNTVAHGRNPASIWMNAEPVTKQEIENFIIGV